jgi:hypothetical protein
MSDASRNASERLLELLADRAAFGLTSTEAVELQRLLAQHPDVDADQFDRLAASIDLSLGDAHPAPLPEALRDKIASGVRTLASGQLDNASDTATLPFPGRRRARGGRPVWFATLGWVAAAACLLVAAWALQSSFDNETEVDLIADRQRLLAEPNVVTSSLEELKPLTKAAGDVVWSPSDQRGYMRLRGLPINDPKRKQYQLWIFDKNQDARYPIDGGVFDITRDGGVIVPIRAAIAADSPTMFAITEEKPGGVVVSAREPIVLLGKVAEKLN